MIKKYALLVVAMSNVAVAQYRLRAVNSTSTTTRYCSRRSNPPLHRGLCSFPVVCEIGTQSCPSGDEQPVKKCECDGQRWTCEEVSCPVPTFTASSTERAFAVRMNLLTDDVLKGYNKKSQLSDDLNQMVRFYVNAFIEDQARYDWYPYILPSSPEFDLPFVAQDGQGDMGMKGPSAEGATDFETNNQEKGVDEADMVKSDGKYVYAGYGNLLVVWNALTGKLITNYTLPDPVGTDVYGNVNSKPALGLAVDYFVPCYKPKASILSLSLDSGRLVLYVEGYGQQLRNSISTVFTYDAFATRILVFDTSTLPTALTLVTQEDIHGSYRDARAIGSNIHVVSTNTINYYPLQQPLYRWNQEFTGMNATEYKAAAAVIAAPLIDKFVATLENDIVGNGIIPNVPKISIWQTDLGENTNIVEVIYSNGAIQSFVQLTSFSVKDLQGDLSLSVAGAFTPSSWGYTYAVDGNLVFAAQAWNWNSRFGGSTETTYLMGFELNGASAKPSFLGSVPGYINNQYYISIFEGHLRVATTVRSFWPIWTQPVEDGRGIWPQPITTTNNTVYVYSLPTNTTSMSEVARVPNLGKPGEVFTAVRFFGNICYAVTFEQVDPFYVIQLDPTDVKVLGELEISGFSSYLHSINNDDTLLLAVGQEADSTGRVLGVQITLFDATDPAKPISLQRTVVEQESDVWSSSSVQWDYKSFRWLSLGDEVGILIMPLQVVAYTQENLQGNFDGFLAYDVSRSGISERLSISHVDSEQFYGCYWRAYLPDRSFVFNGNVTTMKGHSVVSTDLDTGKTGWKLDMPSPTTKEDCGFWFF